jgi:hypothetical protein
MCPDRQLISVYLDGELPSPWKEKMESHLSQCPQCGRLLESFRQFSLAYRAPGYAEAYEKAKERIWQNLEQLNHADKTKVSDGKPYAGFTRYYPARRGIWRRRVSVPLPAAAAAVLLMLASVFFVARKAQPQPGITLGADEYSTLPIQIEYPHNSDPRLSRIRDMNGVLEYLGSKDSGEILILHLPESRSFSISGEPAIIKAADYSRRKR